MTVKYSLTKQEFIDASLAIVFSRPQFKRVVIIFLFFILISFVPFISIPNLFSWESLIYPIVFAMLYFGIIYYSANRNFNSNPRASEEIEYTFTKDFFILKGQSFSSESTLDKVLKVTKTKNWLLIWQSRNNAHAIPLRLVTVNQLKDLKADLDWHSVKNNL
ncbi:MAG: hypothetical protein JST58_19645 [Bacteroidetes bacterium]|nr:hypothetical protein [Bacteroidota bacterium]